MLVLELGSHVGIYSFGVLFVRWFLSKGGVEKGRRGEVVGDGGSNTVHSHEVGAWRGDSPALKALRLVARGGEWSAAGLWTEMSGNS